MKGVQVYRSENQAQQKRDTAILLSAASGKQHLHSQPNTQRSGQVHGTVCSLEQSFVSENFIMHIKHSFGQKALRCSLLIQKVYTFLLIPICVVCFLVMLSESLGLLCYCV